MSKGVKTNKNRDRRCEGHLYSYLFTPPVKIKLFRQDGRLPPAYFSPNYKYFDQFLQTVKNKTVSILVFKEFLQINSTTDFCTLCKRVSRFSLEKVSSHMAKKFVEEPFRVSKKFCCQKMLGIGEGGTKIFRRKLFGSQCRKFS